MCARQTGVVVSDIMEKEEKEKNDLNINDDYSTIIDWPLRMLSLSSKVQMKASDRESFDSAYHDFKTSVEERVQTIALFQPKISQAKGSTNGGRKTRNLEFLWSLHNDLISSIMTEWEVFIKEAVTLIGYSCFKKYKNTGDSSKFGQGLQHLISKSSEAQIDSEFQKWIEKKVGVFQSFSLCSPEELAYVHISEQEYSANLEDRAFPVRFVEVIRASYSSQRCVPPCVFNEDDWKAAVEKGRKENKFAKLMNEFGLLNLVENLFADSERYKVEVCVQLRHLHRHENRTPTDDEKVWMAKLTVSSFQCIAKRIHDNFAVIFED